jgi:hypothetical protein
MLFATRQEHMQSAFALAHIDSQYPPDLTFAGLLPMFPAC